MKVKFIYIFSFMLWSSLLTQAQWTTADLSESRIGLVAGSTGTKVFFAGGNNSSGSPSNVIDIYDNATNTWSTASLSIGRSTLAVAATSTRIFFGGGFIFGGIDSDVVDIFNSNTNTWSTSHLSLARHYLAATSLGTKVFFAGGIGGNVVSDIVDIYDVSNNSWSIAYLSQPRLALTAVANGTKVFFAGGYDIINNQQVYSDVVDIYDMEANTWTTTNLSEARGYLASTSVGSKVFFAGGAGTNFSSTIDIYDLSDNSWSTKTLTGERNLLAAASRGPEVFFAGGANSSENSDVIDIYNINTNLWSTATLSLARNSLAAASIGTKVFFAGGYNSGFHSIIDIYDRGCVPFTINLSSDVAICVGASIILEAEGANTFSWDPSTGLSGDTGSTVTAAPVETTTYTVTGKDLENCTSTATVTVTVNSIPPKPIISGNDLNTETPTLFSSSSSGNQWFMNEVLLEDEVSQFLQVVDEGMYSVQVTLDDCVSPMSEPFPVIITEVNEPIDLPKISIYPNPAQQLLNIEWNGFDRYESLEIKIIDLLGRVALTKIVKAKENTIEIENLNSGVYLIQSTLFNNKVFAKFQKR